MEREIGVLNRLDFVDSVVFDEKMNLFRTETEEDCGDGDVDNSQLLRDIEAISNALYVQQPSPRTLVSPYENRSKSAERSRLLDPNEPEMHKDNVVLKDKKSSLWRRWKKPLKALANIKRHSYNICFFLQVHSVEGLPANFDGSSLCVLWKRKNEVLQTRPSRVSLGVCEFGETLKYKCRVYSTRNVAHNSAKYEEKLFLIYTSVAGSPGVDIGKHWVDFTRLLPLTLDELEGEKSSGKWTTSFKLAGKAKGASLNLSFGFSVMKENLIEPGDALSVSELMNMAHNKSVMLESNVSHESSTANKILRRIGSVPSSLGHRYSHSSTAIDVMVYRDVSPLLGLELSKSINFLYEKLNEGKLDGSEECDLSSEELVSLRPKHLEPESTKDISESEGESDCSDFTVIERGIEIYEKEKLESQQNSACTTDDFAVETINVDEIIKDDNAALDEEVESIPEANKSCCCKEDSGLCSTRSMEELQSAADLESPSAIDEVFYHQNYMKNKSNYKSGRLLGKSRSLDDITESVASEFLNMLGMEQTPLGSSSDGDPESPRERLLREFEKEALTSGNFVLGFDTTNGQVKWDCPLIRTGSGVSCNSFDGFPLLQGAEEENKKAGLLLKNKNPANMLEDLEAESLMQEWGLNERAFQRSPSLHSDGFGSPIEFPTDGTEQFELPPLEDGLGHLVPIKNGGYLRSMNPSLFINAKNVGSLIMQVSTPVVLPVEMGSDIIDILQLLASTGMTKLSVQTSKLMPLEDITGRTLQQVTEEAAPGNVSSKRSVSSSNFTEI